MSTYVVFKASKVSSRDFIRKLKVTENQPFMSKTFSISTPSNAFGFPSSNRPNLDAMTTSARWRPSKQRASILSARRSRPYACRITMRAYTGRSRRSPTSAVSKKLMPSSRALLTICLEVCNAKQTVEMSKQSERKPTVLLLLGSPTCCPRYPLCLQTAMFRGKWG